MFTTATSTTRTPFRKNLWLQGCIVVFLAVWISTFIGNTDLNNWVLENLLVFIFLGIFIPTYRKYQFSDVSYVLFTIFLCLHVYGSQYTYAENPVGHWLKEQLGWERNHYDRIVHFASGFLLAYPWREWLVDHLKFPTRAGWMIPIIMTFTISGMYELIEWAVADIFFSELGPAYLGIQGDVWDAQKDAALAVLGSLIATTIVSFIYRVFRIN